MQRKGVRSIPETCDNKNPNNQKQLCNEDEIGYVMVLSKNAPTETQDWLFSVLAQNSLNLTTVSDSDCDLICLVTCRKEILENAAKHVYMPQQLRRQNLNEKVTSLSLSELQRVFLYLLEKIHSPNRSTLIGFPKVTLYPGQSIVQICHREKVILNYFPLHDHANLNTLTSKFCHSFVDNIDLVRNYFGEKIGFYFAFLNFYQRAFVGISVICLFSYLFNHVPLVNEICTIMICIGLFIFLKLWKRQSNKLACKWGTIEAFELESARPAFRSKGMHLDPVTNELVPFYPINKTWFKEYLISIPFVILSLYFAFEVMCLYFEIENWTLSYYNADPSTFAMVLTYVPSIVYAILVMMMNHAYRVAATVLNDHENHRTQESHENHWIIKLILFEFVNSFISLFYIGFYLKDMAMLKWNLITMLTINQLVDNLVESLLPMSLIIFSKKLSDIKKKSSLKSDLFQVLYEKELNQYEDSYYDYLELFIQFGYSFLFVAVWPLAPVVALINSTIEIRLDAFKFCYSMRRPFQRSAKSINSAWMKSFEVIAILVVISNSMVLWIISDPLRQLSLFFNMSSFELAVYFEHILLLFILMLWYIVPEIPKDVNLILNRQKYSNIKNRMLEIEKKFR